MPDFMVLTTFMTAVLMPFHTEVTTDFTALKTVDVVVFTGVPYRGDCGMDRIDNGCHRRFDGIPDRGYHSLYGIEHRLCGSADCVPSRGNRRPYGVYQQFRWRF